MNPSSTSRIGVIAKPAEPRARDLAIQVAKWAEPLGLDLLISERVTDLPAGLHPASEKEIAATCNLLVVLGGDGTMLAASHLLEGRETPVLGINLGALGYLTEFQAEETLPALDAVSRGEYRLVRRMMLDWTMVRAQQPIDSSSALNEVAVNKSTTARIIEIDFLVGNVYVTTYRADGLIIATPTGSTAYNLSAGGPIVVPGAQVISIAPICPHTLTNRPLVLPDDAEICVQLNTRDQEVMLTSDGQTGVPIEAGDRIEIRKGKRTFNTVARMDRDYFQLLRNKLKWSGR
jgi:NAD+ kinase